MKKSARRRGSARTASVRSSAPVARMMAPAKKAAKKKSPAKKAAKKKSPAKKSAARKTARKTAGKQAATKRVGGRKVVMQIPQSLEKAATQAGVFLYTNDAWSLRYFDPNDLHSLERKLFG
jgi:hypothetical protein